MRKLFFLAVAIILLGSTLIMAGSVSGQSIPKPSIPDFTLKVVAHPYDVPPEYEINPYTGKSEMTEAGYPVENKSIEITIKNQPFTSTQDENGNYANLYYAVRFKGRYADEWKYYPHDMDSNYSTAATPFNASESEYTTINVGLSTYLLNNVPAGGQVDFQVEAFIGYEKRVDFFFLGDVGHYYTFTAFERSGWSNTQTITIGESQTSTPSPATTPTPVTPSPSPIPVLGQSFFFVESNSTVSELFFNSTSAELSFTVNGTTGTAGYVEVTIAKSLVSSVQNVKVFLDGTQLNVAITEDADSWLLSFTYRHSTHQVMVSLETDAGDVTFLGVELWVWIASAVVVGVLLGVAVAFMCRRHGTSLAKQNRGDK